MTIDQVTFETLKTFLEGRIRALEVINSTSSSSSKRTSTSNAHTRPDRHVHVATSGKRERKCVYCNGKHSLLYCFNFKRKPADEKTAILRKLNCCFNCLSPQHLVSACQNEGRCRICSQKHHTLLHSEPTNNQVETVWDPSSSSSGVQASLQPKWPTERNSGSSASTVNTHLAADTTLSQIILLATANVVLRSSTGDLITARALIDPGSESSFLAQSLAGRLKAPTYRSDSTISGIGAVISGRSTFLVHLEMFSMVDPKFYLRFPALVLPKITNSLPSRAVVGQCWPHIADLQLADPTFGQPGDIELLLGADVYPMIVREGIRKGSSTAPVAQCTAFGWILSGPVPSKSPYYRSHTSAHVSTRDINLNEFLQKFWEMEEVPKAPAYTENELKCIQFFEQTTTRDADGRYVVRLPLIQRDSFQVPRSRDLAVHCLHRMEIRFHQNQELFEEYKAFMDEYLRLGHMQAITPDEDSRGQPFCYLPHHPVIKEDSTTTRVRVVFNASFKTANHLSLNDQVHTGPKLQTDLMGIILRWRTHAIVISADIEKMYRQIRIHPEDVDLQRIVWRASANAPIQDYRLLTVTYGMGCAPFLAIQTLHQLAKDERTKYPLGATAILQDAYVDDILSGSFDIPSALELQLQLTKLLMAGGFHLRKWTSNHPELLDHLPSDERHQNAVNLSLDPKIKTLGIVWKPLASR